MGKEIFTDVFHLLSQVKEQSQLLKVRLRQDRGKLNLEIKKGQEKFSVHESMSVLCIHTTREYEEIFQSGISEFCLIFKVLVCLLLSFKSKIL